jgi:putative Mg2+ transporter-C (MgtC) family protein
VASLDLALQIDLALRLLFAAVLGAVIGYEREIHEHPAGMRTHLLVCLGSAVFTVLSIYGFGDPTQQVAGTTDTSRVAAQIVTGIGFLGAGAIIKYGTSVRGLTTAASLWATAAVGMAVGAGWWVVALVTTAIVVFSLWPLNRVLAKIRGQGPHPMRFRLQAQRLEALGEVTRVLTAHRVEIGEINSQRVAKAHYEIELQVRVPESLGQEELVQAIGAVPDLEILETDAGRE